MEWKLGQKKMLKEVLEDMKRENVISYYLEDKKLIVGHLNKVYELTPSNGQKIPHGSNLDLLEIEYEVSNIRSSSVEIY